MSAGKESDADYRNRLVECKRVGVHWTEDISDASGSFLDEIGERFGCSRLTTTKSGQFVIFHINRCPFAKPGAKIPKPYLDFDGLPWFFIPADGNPTAVGRLQGYPLIYSAGHLTEGDALFAAEEWEAKKPSVDRDNAAASASITSLLDDEQ